VSGLFVSGIFVPLLFICAVVGVVASFRGIVVSDKRGSVVLLPAEHSEQRD
jgi:hypothetical protein